MRVRKKKTQAALREKYRNGLMVFRGELEQDTGSDSFFKQE